MSARLVTDAALARFGQRLERLRTQRGWSLVDVSKRIGCSPNALAHWEAGRRVPVADWLFALADLFGCPAEALWRGRP